MRDRHFLNMVIGFLSFINFIKSLENHLGNLDLKLVFIGMKVFIIKHSWV